MAKIYLDANVLIGLIEKRRNLDDELLQQHTVFISPLSIHILCYLYKYKMPEGKLADLEDTMKLIPLNNKVANYSLLGPTSDFEDNVQLHSAAEANCDLFVTNDKKLLSMKFFGKTKIISPEEL